VRESSTALRQRARAAAALLATCAIGAARPAQAEPGTGADKAAHAGVSAALGAGSYALLWALGDDPPALRLGLAAAMGFLPGVAKEIYDAGQPGNRFSGADLFWDGVGAAAGSAALWLIERLVGSRPRAVACAVGPGGLRVGARF